MVSGRTRPRAIAAAVGVGLTDRGVSSSQESIEKKQVHTAAQIGFRISTSMSFVPGHYTSGYVSSKQRAMKYGGYYGAAPVVSAPVEHMHGASATILHGPIKNP